MSPTVVIGGGLGGLLAGAELARRGGEVVVLESCGQPGGVARSIVDNGWLFDPAAGSVILPHPALSPIVEAAGIAVEPATPAARRRFVYDRGSLSELSESPATVFSPLLSWRGKARAVAEPFIRRTGDAASDESLSAFLARRFGPEAGRFVATLMAHGVFAGDPAELSARAGFPAMVELEDAAGSILRGAVRRLRARPKGAPRPRTHVTRGGMSEVADSLAEYLGPGFRPGREVSAIEQRGDGWVVHAGEELEATNVIVTCSAAAAARFVPRELAGILSRSKTAPVAVVGLGGPAPDLPIPDGFGVLAGPAAAIRALGFLFESQYAPGRAPRRHRLAKAIYGGAADRAISELDDGDLVELAVAELGRVIGVTVRPSWVRVVRPGSGIPQYDVGHLRWLSELDTELGRWRGLLLGGWCYRGIGLSGLAADAVRLADTVEGRRLDRKP
ncbi:MAG: Protoporphyrinogen oxidase [Acidimicrobiales bacterium]|nr:Protoporphyrinogen oxidase [Acidimicrobiales bacterium]